MLLLCLDWCLTPLSVRAGTGRYSYIQLITSMYQVGGSFRISCLPLQSIWSPFSEGQCCTIADRSSTSDNMSGGTAYESSVCYRSVATGSWALHGTRSRDGSTVQWRPGLHGVIELRFQRLRVRRDISKIRERQLRVLFHAG